MKQGGALNWEVDHEGTFEFAGAETTISISKLIQWLQDFRIHTKLKTF